MALKVGTVLNLCITVSFTQRNYNKLTMNHLTVKPGATTVMFAGRNYRIQNDRGHRHIVVIDGSGRRKITVKELQTDCVFDYIFGGGSVIHPCPAMDYWIYRHRLGHRITTREYRRRFLEPGEG